MGLLVSLTSSKHRLHLHSVHLTVFTFPCGSVIECGWEVESTQDTVGRHGLFGNKELHLPLTLGLASQNSLPSSTFGGQGMMKGMLTSYLSECASCKQARKSPEGVTEI